MKNIVGICVWSILTGCVWTGAQAAAQDIDPFKLPDDSIERTYGCVAYLNTYSAMGQATDPKNPANVPIQRAYLALAGDAEQRGIEGGSSQEEVRKRMSAWNAAVSAAPLGKLSKQNRDRMQANFKDCIRQASELPVFKKAPAP